MARKIAGLAGFTIAEILLSLTLITVVVLALVGLSLRALNFNRKALDTMAGQIVSEQALERLVYNAEQSASDPVWACNSLTIPYSSTSATMGSTAFNVTIYANDSLTTAGKRLKRLRSRVVWSDVPDGKAGMGILRVEATRFVHEP